MRSLTFLVPGSLETLTGGYGYDRRLIAGLRQRGWSVVVRELDETFPRPTPPALEAAARVLAAIPDRATVLIDGLALGAMPSEVEHEASRLRLVALVHHPLAEETGIDPATAAELTLTERRALSTVRLVVVTSEKTAEALASYDVGRQRIAVVEPGTDSAPLARGSRQGPPHLVCVAALIPRKGHQLLFRALGAIPDRNWRLTCVGSLHRDPATVQSLCDQLRANGLAGHVSLAGEMDPAAVAVHYDAADVFVLPTLYEGYGMAVAEALARGLPVVGTSTGAIADLVGDEAGIVVPPGDVDALAGALSRVLGDQALRERFAQGARRVRNRLPTWDAQSVRMAEALERAAAP